MSEDGSTGQGQPQTQHSLGNGRYVLQHLLGQGGMAAVHLAYDTVLDRQVAVKTLHTELGRESSFRERFRREAQAVARLQHTNIVSVFDSGEEVAPDGATTPYIVMEYVEGPSLRDVLNEAVAQHGAMPTEQALKITAAVLAALDTSHDQGLVHRDIKPGNVMVNTKGVVKVMDFGIARAMQSGVTSMTQTGMVVGTPQYLSPEQALGKSVDARSDLYSVGCMLFELLTGRLPFDGDSPFSIAYKHVQEEPPAPSSLNRAVTPAVDALVARALRKDPSHRFPTAEAMREEVERVQAGAATEGGTPLMASTPLVIGEGPRSAHAASSSLTNFPQVGGDIRTPAPHVQQPYQPVQAPPYGPQTPPPAFNQQTPQPFQGYQTPPPQQQYQTPPPQQQQYQTPPPQQQYQTPPVAFPQQAHNPAPMQRPMPQQAGPFVPQRPAQTGTSGCSTALVVLGVIIGLIVLFAIIIAIVASKASNTNSSTDQYGGAHQPSSVVSQLSQRSEELPPVL
ncbi:serine/threonine protein kinase [Kitasatospora sp. MAP12-15]|uniref:protein kinase domain-containing protein n=1 Tax=unclassified Kitasatospora TaxID=2633591 RepID=UPI002475C0AD|nr:protein kinase [Kitasatospora sp. MAP12-44]MDH6111814.1 serine/threonine protein kinase [Kitasatospora sp. MAP12-44]